MDCEDKGGGKGLLAGGVVALLSAIAAVVLAAFAAHPLGYLFDGGREADATVTGLSVVVVGNDSPVTSERDAWLAGYAFTEPDGTPRTGTATLEPADLPRHGETLRVRYTPGPAGRSEAVGRFDRVVLGALAVTVVVFCVSAVVLARSAARRFREQPSQEFDPCVR